MPTFCLAALLLTACVPSSTPATLVVAGERIGTLIAIGMQDSELIVNGFARLDPYSGQGVRAYRLELSGGRAFAIVCDDTGRVFRALVSGGLLDYRTPEGFGIRSRAPELIGYYSSSPDWTITVLNKRSHREVTVSASGDPRLRYLFVLSLPRDTNRVQTFGVEVDPATSCPNAVIP